jgi:hypothetical protein
MTVVFWTHHPRSDAEWRVGVRAMLAVNRTLHVMTPALRSDAGSLSLVLKKCQENWDI